MSSDAIRMKPWVFFTTIAVIAVFAAILGYIFKVCDECPDTEQNLCGQIADQLCPAERHHDYTSTQAEACRSKLYLQCLESQTPPTIEACRDECSEIVRDLTRANDELWERWLACAEDENSL